MVLLHHFSKEISQLLFITIVASFFIYDRNWTLHLYNGQMYVLYAFVFAVSGYVLSRYTNDKVIIILYPIIALVRPFFITALIPFLKLKKRYVLWLGSGIVIAVLLVTIATTTQQWKEYNAAMKLYAKEQTHELAMKKHPVEISSLHVDPCTINPTKSFAVFGAGCLFTLQHYLYQSGISISNVQVFQLILALMLGALWFIAWKPNWLEDIPKQLILSFLFYQLCELITPAFRKPI